ncbi:NACHT domain-containing protein [Streptomyces sp. NRRL S-920]|uniref:NACHT domain-containing protein n=1 Tax=Streptomyces sp. NRRL S-920 TaxID=1463921 RepID=UPI000997D98A|nr:NACHT domain-containing protein [Streptomyces sp. NRRL S-920]
MEPAVIGARLASSIVGPLVRKLFVSEGPGADLVDRPVAVSGLVSFRGEKRTLSDKDLYKIAEELVRRAAHSTGVEDELPSFEKRAVVHAVTDSLRSLGTLAMDDVQAVRLGHLALSRQLRAQNRTATLGLSHDAVTLHAGVMDTACLHILNFFTQRSTFVPRTLLEQSRGIEELTRKIDALITRSPPPADGPFEKRYAHYIAAKHGKLSIFGLDLSGAPESWRLDVAYLRLDAAVDALSPVPTVVSADHVLAGRDRVLLRGVAGSGKTTLIQWLAVSTANKSLNEQLLYLYGLVPFVLPLRTLTRSGAPLPAPDGFLSAVDCPIAGSQPPGWIDRVLQAGRGLILIDGIDEIPEDDRGDARRWLRELLSAYPDNRWLVTSRPSAVRERWLAEDDFAELDLAPMNRDNIAEFIQRWHKAAGISDQYATELLRAVRAQQDLSGLAVNPLMCGLICALHQDRRGYLPDGRKEIYDAALSMLLFRRDRERGVLKSGPIHISEAEHIQLIQKLAYWMIRNGRSEMNRTDAVELLRRVLPAMPKVAEQGTPEAVYRHLLVRSGLLREPSANSMDFVHRTFQDYLGAKAAVEELDFDFLIANAHLDQWEDVIRMAVAHARPTERTHLLTGLIRRENASRQGRDRLHLLAAACLEHATELDPAVRAEVQERAAALIPPRSTDRARALAAIGPVVLELLTGPRELPPRPAALDPFATDEQKAEAAAAEAAYQAVADEAYFTVLTATPIATDAAVEVLALYRDHPDLRVRSELAQAWSRYDTDLYGQEVVAHLAEDGLYFPVSNLRELSALRSFGGRSRIKITGEFAVDEFIATCPSQRLTHLWVESDMGPAWDWLSHFPALRVLTIETLHPSIDLSTLERVRSLLTLRVPEDAELVGSHLLPESTKVVRGCPSTA